MKRFLSRYFSPSLSLVALALVILSVVGCKKISYDVTKEEAPRDVPPYTVEFQRNISPADGGVRKP
ncbi:hypothetical protein MRY87_02935 [bacterium]|nr:hypothetical protein [bacterium]